MKDGHDPDYAAVMRGIEADGDLILNDALADAETQRLAVEPNIRRFEASQRRRKAIRRAARLGVLAAAVLALLWLFATAAN